MDSKFSDRHHAAKALADRLSQLTWEQPGWVLALPRGGVPIAAVIARQLHWPLDVWLVRKLGVPDQPELAMGAIAAPAAQVLNQDLIRQLDISEAQVAAVKQAEIEELFRRDRLYRRGRSLPVLTNRPVIVVDDGLATGATMQAAIVAIRGFHPSSITVAVPVAAASSLAQIAQLVDRTVCLATPELMGSISQWYVDFAPVADQEVLAFLDEHLPPPHEPGEV